MQARLVCAISMLFTVGFCSCSSDKTAAAAPAAPVTPPAVTTHPSSGYFEASGPIVVENQVEVLAQRDGVIAKLLADADTPVQKGQLLAQMDDRQLTAERDATAAKAKAIAADLQNFETEQKLVEIDLSRDEEMYKANLITQKQLDHSRTKVVGVKFEVERERQNLLNAQANLKALELELEKMRIVAPFAGVVARRYVNDGQRVQGNDKLFWVTATEPLRVRFTVPDTYAGKLKRGQDLTVVSSAAPEMTYKAQIVTVSPVVDPGSGTIDVQAQLAPPTHGLLPGMTATVRLPEAK